jgi:DNA (cytosine-5)-methyltransferase 1
MRFATLCSGIGAPETAWLPLGWECAFHAEIDPFASAVLAERYPNVPNRGDMLKHKEWPNDGTVDLICAGTPCQAFSVAGLRKGLDDPRGNLTLAYLGVLAQYRPRWMVWENVPGVLSIDGGRTFGTFLGGLAKLGYGFAYRVLDAQFIRVDTHPGAVPQRRRRVFVVGCLGDWRRAAAVLLERESLCGYPAPRREAGKGTPRSVAHSLASGGNMRHREDQDTLIPAVAGTLKSCGGNSGTPNGAEEATRLIPAVAGCLQERDTKVADSDTKPGHLMPVAFRACGQEGFTPGDNSPPLCATDGGGTVPTIAFERRMVRTTGGQPSVELQGALRADTNSGDGAPCVSTGMQVRRLTPTECERLQGFPDGHTAINYRGKPACDGPRYKALGNSMAVNVMSWIGQRIQMVEQTRESTT